jgi:hypothetical protein
MSYNEEIELHPSETPLFVAASLRGYKLHRMPQGFLAVYKMDGDAVVPVAAWVKFKEVANLCGATGKTTLRQAAERDGLKWPDSPEAFLAAVMK